MVHVNRRTLHRIICPLHSALTGSLVLKAWAGCGRSLKVSLVAYKAHPVEKPRRCLNYSQVSNASVQQEIDKF